MIRTKKSLGQHFLRSRSALHSIAAAAELRPGECVVEIGPGDGTLTEHLLATGARVIAVEKDRRLIPLLKERFSREIAQGQLTVVGGDALAFDPDRYALADRGYKAVGNIPYYITGALVQTFLTTSSQPQMIVFLVQKEVAERIARSPKESVLSLSVKAYGTPRYVRTVPRGAFQPPPRVDSALVQIRDISRKNFKNAAHEKRFFDILHAGFGSKRKLLVRNLEKMLGIEAADAFVRLGIPSKARAEDVPLPLWLELAEE